MALISYGIPKEFSKNGFFASFFCTECRSIQQLDINVYNKKDFKIITKEVCLFLFKKYKKVYKLTCYCGHTNKVFISITSQDPKPEGE